MKNIFVCTAAILFMLGMACTDAVVDNAAAVQNVNVAGYICSVYVPMGGAPSGNFKVVLTGGGKRFTQSLPYMGQGQTVSYKVAVPNDRNYQFSVETAAGAVVCTYNGTVVALNKTTQIKGPGGSTYYGGGLLQFVA